MLGRAAIRIGGDSLVRTGVWRRRMALLAILAAAGHRVVSRERLTGLLWPEANASVGLNRLKQLKFAIRQAFDADVFEAVGAGVRLDRNQVTCDLWDFERALAGGDADGAVALYGGPFLDGFGLPGSAELDGWIDSERARFAYRYRTACESAAAASTDPMRAIALWREALSVDQFCTRAVVGLMQALAASGDRDGALRYAKSYEILVRDQLQAPLDRAVAALVARLTPPEGSPLAG
jgi:DNA-binding SARP family transcriptional activator